MMKLNLIQLPDSTFACGPAQAHPDLRTLPLYRTFFERSHRAADIVEQIYHFAEQELRRLFALPEDYAL